MDAMRLSTTLSPKSTKLFNLVLVCCSLFLFVGNCSAQQAEEAQRKNSSAESSNAVENPVPQVRYRSRPVTAFHSGPKLTGNANSSENDSPSPSPSGVPFIAVHELTSQTLEKLQENFRNVEAFLRNLRARKSQEDYIRSSSSDGGSSASSGVDTTRRTPYNNVYSFKYHPVVLEGEGSNSVDDIVGGSSNSRSSPPRTFNGISFNPYPFDPKGEGSKSIDMERHTVATIYTIGICLTIMAIGSVMFILINKCDGSAGSSYMHSSAAYSAGNRLTRSVIGAATGRGGRQSGGGRSRNGRSGRSNENASTSGGGGNVTAAEDFAKSQVDLPPSYETLFPEGGPTPKLHLQEIVEEEQTNVEVVVNDPTPPLVNEQQLSSTSAADTRSQGGTNNAAS